MTGHNNILDMAVEHVPLDDLTPYPGNPRIGNRGLIAASLTEHGQYRPLVVQASTGHILAGNNTYHAARDLGWDQIAVHRIDVDDERARRIVAVDNRANDLATYDDRLLAEFLSDLPDLDGTGYDPGDLEAIVASLQTPDLDDLADELGEPKADDGWPSISLRVPHTVKAAWNAHLSTHNDEVVPAFCALLGIDPVYDD